MKLGNRYKESTVRVLDKDKVPKEVLEIFEKTFSNGVRFSDHVSFNDEWYIEETIKKENQPLEKGSKVRVDRWDGNGISEYVTVKEIVDDLIVFEEGIAYWGKNLIWKGKDRDRYWNNSHCFIEWDDYYVERAEKD